MLYEYIKDRMLATPAQTVGDEERRITYQELLDEAEALGRRLKERPEEKYGILCRSELNAARSLLACLYAQKTAVPLSYRYGETHIRKIVDAVHLSHALTDDGIETLGQASPETEDLTDVALIMCTSGTTGTPKGAMITGKNLFTNLRDIEKYFRIDRRDRILIARPLYHCAVLTGEFLISLIKGLSISFLSGGFNPALLLRRIREQSVTVLCGTPTLFYHLSALALRNREATALRVMAVSGECMTTLAAERMRNAFPEAQIYNVYGLTEASPRVSWLPPERFDACPLSAGKPLASLRVRIVDGELQVAGDSVMKGYYRNPSATEKTIVDGWLHTGDMAEMDEQGQLYIKCRKDSLIIRSGMNVYPQEIENAMRQDDRIADALAFGVRDASVGERIHLHVVSSLSRAEVFAVCRARLPGYQLPDVLELVPEIPKNASGKVIRKKKASENENPIRRSVI